MSEGQPLRFYAKPLKLLLLLLGSAIFVAIGYLLLRDPRMSANLFNVVMAWAAIILFGLGVAFFLIIFIRDAVFRLPVLQIDERGWVTRTTLFVKKQTTKWQDIDHVAIYRQWTRQSLIRRRPEYMYWLVVHGVDPSKVARRPRFSARMYRFYPALREALMVVPLNNLFVRMTQEKVERVLASIRDRYDDELRLNQIRFDTQIHRL